MVHCLPWRLLSKPGLTWNRSCCSSGQADCASPDRPALTGWVDAAELTSSQSRHSRRWQELRGWKPPRYRSFRSGACSMACIGTALSPGIRPTAFACKVSERELFRHQDTRSKPRRGRCGKTASGLVCGGGGGGGLADPARGTRKHFATAAA